DHVTWDGGPWFEISVPTTLATQGDLYLDFEEQSNSFVIPFLAHASGFINMDGDYVLGYGGANGARVRSLINGYSPHLRTLVLQSPDDNRGSVRPPDLSHENDTLAHYGLQVDASDCERIRIRDFQGRWIDSLTDGPQGHAGSAVAPRVARVAQPTEVFLVT